MRSASKRLVVALVPVVFGLSMMGPEGSGLPLGVGPALGCGAGGNVPQPQGFTVLVPALLGPSEQRDAVPVGTDGFFVIVVGTSGLDAETTLSTMIVNVRGEAGEVVSGRIWQLKEQGPGSYLFGWEAYEPLELGAQLVATLDAGPWVQGNVGGGEFPLVVAGRPVPLPKAALTFSDWGGFFRGAGSNVTCAIDPELYPCEQSASIEVPGSLEELQSAYALWQLPEVSVGVAWEARLEASTRERDAELSEHAVDFLAEEPGPPVSLGLMTFPTSADEHCVTLAIRDLRSTAFDSEEFCFATEAPASYATDSDLGACLEPPTEATREAWCRLKGEQAPEECQSIIEGAGEPGAGGSEGDDAARGSRTSKGCQLASGEAGASSILAAALGLVCAARRRRR